MYRLVFESGPAKGRRLTVKRGTVVIGSAPDCHIQLEDSALDAHHIAIEWRSDGTWIRLLATGKPLLLNGQPVTEEKLADGDRVTLGQTVISFRHVEPLVAEHARRISTIQTLTFISIGIIILFEIIFLAGLSVWRIDKDSHLDEEPMTTPTSNPVPVLTATPEPTATPKLAPTTTPTPNPTATPVPTRTPPPKPTAPPTPEPTATATSKPSPTPTKEPTATATPMPTPTPKPTSTPKPKPTATTKPTKTPKPTATPTPKPTPPPKPTRKPTKTPTPTKTPKPTATPKPTDTPKPSTPTPVPTPHISGEKLQAEVRNLSIRFGITDSAVTDIAQRTLFSAFSLWEAGDTKGAINKMEEAIIIAPDYYPAQVKLAALYESTGSIKQARKQWRQLKKETRDTLWQKYIKQQSSAFEKRH